MYHILKAVILARGFELKSMLTKINNFWAEGSISESERKDLIELAQENAHFKNEVDILAKLEEIEQRLKVLENKDVDDNKPNADTYPEYVAGKWYYKDDKVTFDGATYVCTAPDKQVCTWSPTEYPAYWQKL